MAVFSRAEDMNSYFSVDHGAAALHDEFVSTFAVKEFESYWTCFSIAREKC